MKVFYTRSDDRLGFEAEAANVKEAFEFLSSVQELFEETTCGLCGKEHLVYEVREYDGNAYYKLHCRDCGATLDFGQRKDGANLFIKRKDAEGNYLPDHGWYIYQGARETPPPRTGPSPSRPTTKERKAERESRQATPRQGREPGDPVPF